MNKPDLDQLLTPREAAKFLDLPTQTIRDMIKRKELLAFKVGGQCGQWRIRESELTKWAQRHRA